MSDPISELKHELLAAAERQHGHAAERAGGRRLRRHLGRNRVLAVATLPIAAAVALLFTAPWSNSPSFLARAEAALTSHGGRILHQKWEVTSTSTDPACTVKRGPNEIWIDQTPPHRYRVLLLNDLPAEPGVGDPRGLACASGMAAEFGGTRDSFETLRFVPPNTLVPWRLRLAFVLDPVTRLREAISAGTAHDEGKTELDGRTVERIRIDPPSDCPLPSCPREPSYAYVDPETFHPVETRGPGFIALVGGPVVARLHLVARILTYEYLPRTEANLALTDIRAQHPNATGP
jgi:hypothetical protein